MPEGGVTAQHHGPSILVVDDDPDILGSMSESIREMGFEPLLAESALKARRCIIGRQCDVAVIDIVMPDENGLSLARELKAGNPDLCVIMVTGQPHPDQLRELASLDVRSFLTKPFTFEQFRYSVLGAIERHKCIRSLHAETTAADGADDYGLKGSSAYVSDLRGTIRMAARNELPVVIQGPSGTGKEIIARAIHAHGGRKAMDMITVNCAAIPRHLEESEFFGHTKGAFTGATVDRRGIMACANGSTVFLDEIAELSPDIQAKLLRVLDTGEYTPVGESRTERADIRVICATNRDLQAMMESGAFRLDLYFRLKGVVIQTRPLVEHAEDIPELVRHFLAIRGEAPGRIQPEALAMLQNRPWPGNVRELRLTLELLLAATGKYACVDRRIAAAALSGDPAAPSPSTHESSDYYEEKTRLVEKFDRAYFFQLLSAHQGNVTQAAKSAGIPRTYLQKKLRGLGLDLSEFRGQHHVAG